MDNTFQSLIKFINEYEYFKSIDIKRELNKTTVNTIHSYINSLRKCELKERIEPGKYKRKIHIVVTITIINNMLSDIEYRKSYLLMLNRRDKYNKLFKNYNQI